MIKQTFLALVLVPIFSWAQSTEKSVDLTQPLPFKEKPAENTKPSVPSKPLQYSEFTTRFTKPTGLYTNVEDLNKDAQAWLKSPSVSSTISKLCGPRVEAKLTLSIYNCNINSNSCTFNVVSENCTFMPRTPNKTCPVGTTAHYADFQHQDFKICAKESTSGSSGSNSGSNSNSNRHGAGR